MTVGLGEALSATAGFNINTNGWTINNVNLELAIAIPLRKPPTPIPREIHIFSKWEEINNMNESTGMDVIKEYPVNTISTFKLNVPTGKSVMPIFSSARFCIKTAIRSNPVKITNLQRYMEDTFIGSIYIFLIASPLTSEERYEMFSNTRYCIEAMGKNFPTIKDQI